MTNASKDVSYFTISHIRDSDNPTSQASATSFKEILLKFHIQDRCNVEDYNEAVHRNVISYIRVHLASNHKHNSYIDLMLCYIIYSYEQCTWLVYLLMLMR